MLKIADRKETKARTSSLKKRPAIKTGSNSVNKSRIATDPATADQLKRILKKTDNPNSIRLPPIELNNRNWAEEQLLSRSLSRIQICSKDIDALKHKTKGKSESNLPRLDKKSQERKKTKCKSESELSSGPSNDVSSVPGVGPSAHPDPKRQLFYQNFENDEQRKDAMIELAIKTHFLGE